MVALQPPPLRRLRRAGGGGGRGRVRRHRPVRPRSTSGCATRRAARRRTSAASSTTTGWCSPRSRPCTAGRRAARRRRSAGAARSSPTRWPTSSGAATCRRSVPTTARSAEAADAFAALCDRAAATRPARRHRVAAVHEHRHRRRRAGDRRGGRPPERRLLRRHLAPQARCRRRVADPGLARRAGVRRADGRPAATPAARSTTSGLHGQPRAAGRGRVRLRRLRPPARRRSACGRRSRSRCCSTELWAAPADEAARRGRRRDARRAGRGRRATP